MNFMLRIFSLRRIIKQQKKYCQNNAENVTDVMISSPIFGGLLANETYLIFFHENMCKKTKIFLGTCCGKELFQGNFSTAMDA